MKPATTRQPKPDYDLPQPSSAQSPSGRIALPDPSICMKPSPAFRSSRQPSGAIPNSCDSILHRLSPYDIAMPLLLSPPMCGPFRLSGTLTPSKGPSGCTEYPPPNFVCSPTTRFHRDLRLGRSLAYARGTAPPAVRLSPDTVLPLCNYLLPTSCSAANWLRGRGRKGPTQQAQTGPLFSSLVLVGSNSHLGAHSTLSLRVDKRSNSRPLGKKSPAQSWQRSSPNNVLPSKYGAPRSTRAEHHHTTGKVTLSH